MLRKRQILMRQIYWGCGVAILALAAPLFAGKGGNGGGKPGNGGGANANYAFAYAADGMLHLTTIDGSITRDLTDAPGFAPSWSPDLDPDTPGYQGEIAYWQGPRKNNEAGINKYLYVINPDGSGNRFIRSFRFEDDPNLVPDSWLGGKNPIAWSPSGREVVYSTLDAIYAVEVATGNLRLLMNHPLFPYFGGNTMDGPTVSPLNMLAFGFNGDIYIANFWLDEHGLMHIDDETTLTNITHDNSQIYDAFPNWSPDGTYLAFTSDYQLVAYDGLTDEFSNIGGPGVDISWSPDGSQISFSGFSNYDRKGFRMNDLYRIVNWDDPGHYQVVPVTQTDGVSEFHPAWNPGWSSE